MREHELQLTKRIWITEETHKKLREMRNDKEQSMARILLDLVDQEYEKIILNSSNDNS